MEDFSFSSLLLLSFFSLLFLYISLSFSLSSSSVSFSFILNKYRFRLFELTPVLALYPLLTRIEFRTNNRSFSTAIFSEARLMFFSSRSLFSVKQCWPAGPEVRRCVCPKGDFDQTQSIPLNLHAHPRRSSLSSRTKREDDSRAVFWTARRSCASKINNNLRCIILGN